LIEQDGILLDEKDRSGQSPLLLAASNGHGSAVELLLCQDNVDPNSVDGSGATSLILAMRSGHIGRMAASRRCYLMGAST
jgi:ankyrin repeat protein